MALNDFVWYTGKADERVMTPADWVAKGTTGPEVKWNKSNGFSVLKEDLTIEQLGVLAESGDFRFDGGGTTRPGTMPQSADRQSDPGRQALGWLGKHIASSGGGHVFISPDGSQWILSVSNAGAVSATPYSG